MNLSECPTMTADEFRQRGYLAEVNRQLLHPLGLALGVFGTELRVIDSRDDPEGVHFDDETLAAVSAKAQAVADEWERREPARVQALGYMVQPVEPVATGPGTTFES